MTVIFLNTPDTFWNDEYDSYLVNSVVGTGAGATAELTIGGIEVLAATRSISSTVSGLLSVGIVEILSSTTIAQSDVQVEDTEIGGPESVSSSNSIVSLVEGFINLGVAEGLTGTITLQSSVNNLFTIGQIEFLGTSIFNTSTIPLAELTIGIVEILKTDISLVSIVSSPQLVIGAPEPLSGTSLSTSSISVFLILGVDEFLSSTSNSILDVSSTMSFGVDEQLTSTIICQSNVEILLTTGIVEILSSSISNVSISDGTLIIGNEETLQSGVSVNSVVDSTLTLGVDEVLSSSIYIQSILDNLFTIGVIEVLASTGPISSTITDSELDLGIVEILEVTNLAESSTSAFITMGVTEPLSGSLHIQFFIRKGGAWSNLTIGHTELLSSTQIQTSFASAITLDIGLSETLSSTCNIVSNIDVTLTLGHVELLATTNIISSNVSDSELTIGELNDLSGSILINSVISSFIIFGTTEPLFSSISANTTTLPSLNVGIVELLSTTNVSISSVGISSLNLGVLEVLSSTCSLQSSTYGVLVLGSVEELSSTLTITSLLSSPVVEIGLSEILISSIGITSVVNNSTLTIGATESLSATKLIQSNIPSAVITLGTSENIAATKNIISFVVASTLTLGVDTPLSATSSTSSIVENVFTTGTPEELSGSSLILSSVISWLLVGDSEVLSGTSLTISYAVGLTLATGIVEVVGSTATIISSVSNTFTMGVIEPLSSTISYDSSTSGSMIIGEETFMTTTCHVVSSIRKGGAYSKLTIGVVEILEATAVVNIHLPEFPLTLGVSEDLSSTYYFLGSSNVDALLTRGLIELLTTSQLTNSSISGDLTIGHVEELTYTDQIQSSLTGEITFGSDEELTGSSQPGTYVGLSDLIFGIVEVASSIAAITSVTEDTTLDIGHIEELSVTDSITTEVDSFILLGVAVDLSSTCNIQSTTISTAIFGVFEPITSTAEIISEVSAQMWIGVLEQCSASSSSFTYVYPILTVGILEVLGATTSSHSITPADLTIGTTEILEATQLITTSIESDLMLGAVAVLQSSFLITSSTSGLLAIGVVEVLASSNPATLSTPPATLTIGADEILSSTYNIISVVNAEITMGELNELSSSISINSIISNPGLITGVVELLSSTEISTLNLPPAFLSLGLESPLESAISIVSNIPDTGLIIGVTELLSSTQASTVSAPPADLTFGIGEYMSGTAAVDTSIDVPIYMGVSESLSSSISFSDDVQNTIDLVIGGPVPISATISIFSSCTGTYLFSPGTIEQLSGTLTLQSVTSSPNVYPYTSSISAISDAFSMLTIGVLEVTSSTIATTTGTASEITIGLSEMFYGTAICELIITTDLSLGAEQDLSGTSACEVYSTSSIILGISELFSSSNSSTVNAPPAELTIGVIENLSATSQCIVSQVSWLIQSGQLELLISTTSIQSSSTTTGLIIGVVELAASGILAQSDCSCDPDLYVGDSHESLSSRIYAGSFTVVKKILLFGVSEILKTVIDVKTNISASITMGLPDELSSTVNITTATSSPDLVIGILTFMESTSDIVCFVDGWIQLGNEVDMTATSNVLSVAQVDLTSPTIWIGVSHTDPWNKIVTNVQPAYLVVGYQRDLGAEFNPLTITSTVSDSILDLNDIIELEVSFSFSSVVQATISGGTLELLASSNMSTSQTPPAQLVTGIVEVLGVTDSISTSAIADLTDKTIYLNSTTAIQSTVDALLSGPIPLTSTGTINSQVLGNIVPGRVELLASSTFIASIADCDLEIIGVIEELSSTVGIVSFIPDTLAVTALSGPNPLDPWSVIQTNVQPAYLFVGYQRDLSAEFNPLTITSIVSNAILGVGEWSSGISIQSDVTASLYTGEPVYLSSTSSSTLNVIFSPISLGVPEPLSGHSACVTDLRPATLNDIMVFGTARAKSKSWAFITMGVAEHFESGTTYAVSNVTTTGLVVNVFDLTTTRVIQTSAVGLLEVKSLISATANVISSAVSDSTLGVVELIFATVPISTDTIGDLVTGEADELSSTIFIESKCDGFIYAAITEPLFSEVIVVSNVEDAHLETDGILFGQVTTQSNIITPYLGLGIVEILSSSISTQSIVNVDPLIIGVSELLAVTISNTSAVASELTLGDLVSFSGTSTLGSQCSSHIILGITEVLSSSINAQISIQPDLVIVGDIAILESLIEIYSDISIPDLYIGIQELFSGTSFIQSKVLPNLITGDLAPLDGSSDSITTCSSNLYIGTIEERFTSSINIVTNVQSVEQIGIIEALSSTVMTNTTCSNFFTIGVSETLTSTLNIQSVVSTIDITLGIFETLSSTISTISDSEALSIGLEIEFNSSASVQFNIPDLDLTIGHVEELSSTIIITTESDSAIPIFGVGEILSATALAQISIAARITMGEPEGFSAFISITTDSKASWMDIDVLGIYSRRISADLQYWFDQFLISTEMNKYEIPGAAIETSIDVASEKTFHELLFNDDYSHTSYRYLYREIEDRLSWPSSVKSRMLLQPMQARYFVADDDDPEVCSVNLYNLQVDDIIMLDRLLIYRIDTGNATLAGLDYDSLTTNLAKMIYIYLDMKLNDDYSKYDSVALMSAGADLLETLYETYLSENIFKYISQNGS